MIVCFQTEEWCFGCSVLIWFSFETKSLDYDVEFKDEELIKEKDELIFQNITGLCS